jgi:hypothetical protein
MKSVCAYLKFDSELSICAAKNKHCFHINEVNFILNFSSKNNAVIDNDSYYFDLSYGFQQPYYSTMSINFHVVNSTN